MTTKRPHVLRHFVLVSPDADAVSAKLQSFLDVPAGHRKDMSSTLGFRTEMMMIGPAMLEIVQPVAEDHRLWREFATHGGEHGYMLVFQTFDAESLRARADAERLRLMRDMRFRGQELIQFDPQRFGTRLEVYEYRLPNGWWGDPVGTHYAPSRAARDIVAAHVATVDPPDEVAAQVGRLFESPVADARVTLVDRSVHFTAARPHPGLHRLDCAAIDRTTVGRSESICGVEFRLV